MSVVAYEDLHEHAWGGYYAIPNEGTTTWREVVKGTRIWRAAAICSSGEVGLFGILPVVRRELVLIDHSYRSLQVAALKYLLIRQRGAKEAYRLCTEATQAELQREIAALKGQLPKGLQDKFPNEGGLWLQPYKREGFKYDRRGYAIWSQDRIDTGHGGGSGDPGIDHRKVQGEWKEIKAPTIAKVEKKLNRVKFIHGDITDLVKAGPFGLVYLSNALSHPSRHKSSSYYAPEPVMKQIEAAVKPGGYVLLATTEARYGGDARYQKRKWELVGSQRHYMRSWDQQLWKLPQKEALSVDVSQPAPQAVQAA